MSSPRNILGFHAFMVDSAAALARDGEIIAAVSEERLDREKHSGSFPINAIEACLREGGIEASDLDAVAYTFRPWRHMSRRLMAMGMGLPGSVSFLGSRGAAWGGMMGAKIEFARRTGAWTVPVRHHLHHRCHAATAFHLSGYESAAVLVMDGSAEAAATTIYRAGRGGIETLATTWFPHSLGYLYQAATRYLGFRPVSDEGKIMGLAAYGDPGAFPDLGDLVRLLPGGYALNLRWFDFHRNGAHPDNDLQYFSRAFIDRYGPARAEGEPLRDRHADVAAGVQAALERAVLHLAGVATRLAGERRLALAGGVALNSVANGLLLEARPDLDVFVPPPCGDDGAAIGAALLTHSELVGSPAPRRLRTPFLGPGYAAARLADAAGASRLPHRRVDEPWKHAARLVAEGKVVAWYQGRSEVGPRALGHRSILADPRDPEMKDRLNAKVKHREPFRPFAPVVPSELYSDWFEGRPDRPYMLEVARVRADKKATIPAVTHVDGTARVQTVAEREDDVFWALLHELGRLTGVPIVINTSFNVMGQPLVQTPEEALACYAGTGIDALLLGDLLFEKVEG